MGLDKLNRQQEAKPDGVFDAIEGLTVNTQYARIIFPVTEPFGDYLRDQFNGRNDLGDYYCYDALYDSTKWLAQQDVKHNKFFLQGSYKSTNGAELFLGTTNLQRGSVRVTANGRPLQEGMDYEVDYAMGRVRIINQGLLQGGAEIRASADGQSMFNIQQKTLGPTLGCHRMRMQGDQGMGLNLLAKPMVQSRAAGGQGAVEAALGVPC